MAKTVLTNQEWTERRELILALLEEKPYTTGELAALAKVHRGSMGMALKTMAREQLLHRGEDDRWRLGIRVLPAAAAARSVPLDQDLEDQFDDAGDEVDTGTIHVETALRQPKAPTKAVTERAPSWWTLAPQQGFSARASAEFKRMRWTKEAHQVPLRLLQ